MAVDLTRDDLARLRHGKHVAETHGSMDSERAYWRDLAECADALLAAAERDLDRREGLVFGPEYADVRHAVAADGVVYVLRGSAVYGWGFWLLYATARAPIKAYATEAEAIAAARAHDKARRGGK